MWIMHVAKLRHVFWNGMWIMHVAKLRHVFWNGMNGRLKGFGKQYQVFEVWFDEFSSRIST